MKADEVRQKYIDFFTDKVRKHKQIPPAPLVPSDADAGTTLFTGSGMQQLVPYLKGEAHPMGTRLVNSQPCFRAEDIEEVGDNRHTTFFEMLGNWSLGDYFKDDQLEWFWTFLIEEIGLPKEKLWVTIFDGDENFKVLNKNGKNNTLKPDIESKDRWIKLGVPEKRIRSYDAEKNWWSRSGTPGQMPVGEIGGPDSEIFFEFTQVKHNSKFGNKCHPNCDCGRFLEIGNSVFMQYKKVDERTLEELPNKNVDFGGGLERIAAASENNPDVFQIEIFSKPINIIKGLFQLIDPSSSKPSDYLKARSPRVYQNVQDQDKHQEMSKKSIRIIADHLRAATFLLAEEVFPTNKKQGYILRRLIRRSILQARNHMDIKGNFTKKIARAYIDVYADSYPTLQLKEEVICRELDNEETKFRKTLDKGLREFDKFLSHKFGEVGKPETQHPFIVPKDAFKLYETFGFPVELTIEIAIEKGIKLISNDFFKNEVKRLISEEEFIKEHNKNKKYHSEKSRKASAGMFKGGLADHSEATTKLHTATHLLHKALRDVLGDHVQQTGSNITSERLRFDFKHPQKLTQTEITKVQNTINRIIKQNLPVHKTIEDKDQALKSGALAFFKEKYPDKVSVYTIGKDPHKNWWSKELCGGPHVTSTGEIGAVKINKEQSIGGSIRRIYAVLSNGTQ